MIIHTSVLTEEPSSAPTTLETIFSIIEHVFSVTPHDLKSACRQKRLTRARFAFVRLMRTYTLHSYPAIGRFIHRDHSTAMYQERRCIELMAEDPEFRALVFRAHMLIKELEPKGHTSVSMTGGFGSIPNALNLRLGSRRGRRSTSRCDDPAELSQMTERAAYEAL